MRRALPLLLLLAAADARSQTLSDSEIWVTAERLDRARLSIQPALGASAYRIDQPSLTDESLGQNAPFNQVLLRAPGVAQDSFGQLHVRGDHANLQFRINGVELPEGIQVFGAVLQTRFADSVTLLTGALPAQYGLRTAGVVDIVTKSGLREPGGRLETLAGDRGTVQPSAEFGLSAGRFDLFATAIYVHDGLGIEGPTARPDPIHDTTDQGRFFALGSYLIGEESRVSAMLGSSRSQFQIPAIPGQATQGNSVTGIAAFDSARLNENQREITHFGLLTFQQSGAGFDYQLSTFGRTSGLAYKPDRVGDILFNGIAQDASRRDNAAGLQADGRVELAADHTLRLGAYVLGERAISHTNSAVLALDGTGAPLSDQPVTIAQRTGRTGWTYSLYAQDEWQVTDGLTVNAGLRTDLVNQYVNADQISPRLNVVWTPFEGTTLHAGYARTFTPPPFELVGGNQIGAFANTSAATAVTQADPVKPERADYGDLGIRHELLPGLTLGADGYYKEADDLLDEGQFGSPIILTPFNYAHARIYGLELTGAYQQDGFQAYANLAFSRAVGKRIVSAQYNFAQNDLDFIARHSIHLDHDQDSTLSAGAAYRFETGTLVSADLLYGSGLRRDGAVPNGDHLPEYATVNLAMAQTLALPGDVGLGLRLDVVNLFDRVYKLRDGTGVGVGAPQFGARRAFYGTVSLTF